MRMFRLEIHFHFAQWVTRGWHSLPKTTEDISPRRLIIFHKSVSQRVLEDDPFRFILLRFSAPSNNKLCRELRGKTDLSMQFMSAFKAMNIWKGKKGIADWIGTTQCLIRTGTLVGTWDELKHITNLLRDEWPSVIIYSYWKLRGSRKLDAWESRFSVLHWQLHDVLKGNEFILILSFLLLFLFWQAPRCGLVERLLIFTIMADAVPSLHKFRFVVITFPFNSPFSCQRTTHETRGHFRTSFVLVKFSLRMPDLRFFLVLSKST